MWSGKVFEREVKRDRRRVVSIFLEKALVRPLNRRIPILIVKLFALRRRSRSARYRGRPRVGVYGGSGPHISLAELALVLDRNVLALEERKEQISSHSNSLGDTVPGICCTPSPGRSEAWPRP